MARSRKLPAIKGGPRDFDAKTLAAIHRCYLELRGNHQRTARVFGITPKTVKALAETHNWAPGITAQTKRTQELTVLSVAESRARQVEALDLYLDKQRRFIADEKIRGTEATVDGFDPKGFESASKLRELLTGGATERPDLGSLSDDELRARLQRIGEQHGDS